MKKIKRIANLRLPAVFAVCLVCGIAYSYCLAYYKIDFIYVLAAIAVAACAVVISLFGRRKFNVVCVVVASLLFIIGAVYCAAVFNIYGQDRLTTSSLTNLEGILEEIGNTSSGKTYFILSGASADGVSLNGKVIAYLSDKSGGFADVGYKMSCVATLEKCDAFVYGQLNTRFTDGITYMCNIHGGLQSEYAFSLFGSVRSGIYATLYNNLDAETAAVAYAMITGNTHDISEQTLTSFRYGGIAHVFAVSGLHIGVLFAALSFILDGLRLNKYLSSFLKIALLIFYAGVCGFTPSSVRAAVMCAVLTVSKLVYKKYDSLNSLSVAVILLLLINPVYLFDAGFILSVSAMLGIILLSHNVKRALFFLPYKIRGGVAVGLSAQAATFPSLLIIFGYVSVAGLLLNILFLPLLSVFYVIIFAATVICTVIPPLAPLTLPAICTPLQLFLNFCVHSGFEKGILSAGAGWWLAALIFILIGCLSDKFNLKRIFRGTVCAVCALSIAMISVFINIVPNGQCKVTIGGYYGGGMVILRTQEGATLILTDELDPSRIDSFILHNALDLVDDVIIIGGDDCFDYYFRNSLGFGRVFLSQSVADVGNLESEKIHYVDTFSLYGVDYEFIDSYTLTARVNGVQMGICAGEYINLDSVDLLVSIEKNVSCKAQTTVYFDNYGGDYNVYSQGRLQFVANNSTLKKTGLSPKVAQ